MSIEDDVGTVAVDRGEDAVAVVDLGDHLDRLGATEQHPQARADQRVVVDQHQADHGSCVQGQRRDEDEPAGVVPFVAQLAVRQLDPLAEADQPTARAGERRSGGRRQRGGIADLDLQRSLPTS